YLPKTAQDTTQRLAALRALMRNKTLTDGGIQAYIIPSPDPHQTEYVASQHKRREFLTGFSGSRGTAIVTQNSAALWTDGRYFVQADMELDCNWILQREGLPTTPKYGQWLKMNVPPNSTVGVDPFLLSVCKSWQDKVNDIQLEMKKKKTTAVVLQALDEIAWLFNLRGHDISYSPVFFSYAIVTLRKAILFIDKQKVNKDVRLHLNNHLCTTTALCVEIKPYESVIDYVENLGKDREAKIWVRFSITQYCSYALRMVIPFGRYVMDESPVAFPKAVKNQVEIEGMRRANVRDAVVICEYLAWLEKEVPKNSSNLTEISAEKKMLEFRKQQDNYISLSFATISGFGSNSAIIHYKANNFTDRQITDKGFYLLDTGGQYRDGTTDTTRTVHFGTPTQHEIDSYTRVLMGHLDIAMAVFPNDTYGRTLDVFAREPLWRVGLDYRHGTGHGIGHFLNVHEGPQCISPGFPVDEERVLTKGMILSDEPGYYEDGQFGVRLETAVLVESANTEFNFNKLEYLKFEPIIYVPFHLKLINTSLLRPTQIAWLNAYHKKTKEVIGAEMVRQKKIQALRWLSRQTSTIPYPDYQSIMRT
ncbi:hypothetical protein QZH41_017410, partial [Actinostola sp. cb2023]